MTDAMTTNRMIQPTAAPQGPLAVGERRHGQKRQPPPPRPKADRPLTERDEERGDESGPGRAIDIRI